MQLRTRSQKANNKWPRALRRIWGILCLWPCLDLHNHFVSSMTESQSTRIPDFQMAATLHLRYKKWVFLHTKKANTDLKLELSMSVVTVKWQSQSGPILDFSNIISNSTGTLFTKTLELTWRPMQTRTHAACSKRLYCTPTLSIPALVTYPR